MDCFAEPVIGRAFARPVGSQWRYDTPSHSRGAKRPRFAKNLRPENRGRGECRAPDAPAASCALLV